MLMLTLKPEVGMLSETRRMRMKRTLSPPAETAATRSVHEIKFVGNLLGRRNNSTRGLAGPVETVEDCLSSRLTHRRAERNVVGRLFVRCRDANYGRKWTASGAPPSS
jgi:hypothetical protein